MIKNFFKGLDFSRKLILFTFLSTIFVSFSIAIPTYTVGKSLIFESTEKQLELIREAKKSEFLDYFNYKINDIKIIRNSFAATLGFRDMKLAFDKLAQQQGGVENAKNSLRKVYMDNNPFSKENRGNLVEGDKSEYSIAHAKIMPIMSSVLKERNYYDIFLVDARTGNVLFTIAKEDDYMANLLDGKYKDSSIAKLFRNILNSSNGGSDVQIADFEPYAPSNNDIHSFIGTGVFFENKLHAVLIFQLPIKEIGQKVRKPLLDSKNEISYLVGADFLLRNDLEEKPAESLILKKKVETETVKKAMLGETGVQILEKGLQGKPVFSSYTPIQLLGNKFALIIDTDLEESLIGYHSFQKRIIIITLIVILITLLASYWLSKSFSLPIRDSVNLLSTSIREIGSVIDNHERTTSMQSASVNETTTTLNNISSSSKVSADESMIATGKAKEAEELSSKGHGAIVEMMESIDDLKTKVSGIAEQILRLADKNSQISNIIGLVSELANETNMLALNAAVEAARAGENGKGFEVVAVEIRKLADESKKSAMKIQEIISEIKTATDSTVMVTEEGVKQAELSSKLGNKLIGSFAGINESVGIVFESIEKISLNIRQQSFSISEIVSAMNSINHGSQETATGTAQTKVGINQISDATKKLRDMVEGNKLL
jgi:methyl-accepting chemotaxis protein